MITTATRKTRAERRRRKRIQLTTPVLARIGSYGAVILDLSDGGARIEHYNRLKTGAAATLRFEIEGKSLRLSCRVVACRVARFAAGDDGLTVYTSGLSFNTDDEENIHAVHTITSTFTARALAEQVANAKGVRPLDVEAMPIFREGGLAANQLEKVVDARNKHLIPIRKLVDHRGFIRCRLRKDSWTKTWTLDPEQPDEGFTVSIHESSEQIDLLCETYQAAGRQERQFIRRMARLSVDSSMPTDE